MKRTSALVLCVLFFGNLLAQIPVITRAEYYEVEDTVLVTYYHSSELNNSTAGAAGADVVWDFSFAEENSVSDTLFFIDPVGTPFNPTFAPYDDANLCYQAAGQINSPEEDTYHYLHVNEDSLSVIGKWAANGVTEFWENHCTDFTKEITFPFTYEDQMTDSFDCFFVDLSGSGEHWHTGTQTAEADGYGTLIMPDGTEYENVLRVLVEQNLTDSTELFGVQEFTIQKYVWYSSEHKGPIALADVDVSNQVMFSLLHWVLANEVDTSIDEPNVVQTEFKLVPSFLEANTVELINKSGALINSIRIVSTSGQVVYEEGINSVLNSKQITLDLQSGIYFVSIVANTKIHSLKLIKI